MRILRKKRCWNFKQLICHLFLMINFDVRIKLLSLSYLVESIKINIGLQEDRIITKGIQQHGPGYPFYILLAELFQKTDNAHDKRDNQCKATCRIQVISAKELACILATKEKTNWKTYIAKWEVLGFHALLQQGITKILGIETIYDQRNEMKKTISILNFWRTLFYITPHGW